MSRIASVKETGEEISQTDWTRFERAVRTEVEQRESDQPQRDDGEQPSRSQPVARDDRD